MKTAANKLMMVGRATMLAVGLAVTLALMLGIATAALAAVPGDPFRLGQVNPINTITRLAGNTDNPMLRINNASTGANATALDLLVAQGKPPMKVNSTTEVQNLNVDSLDSRNSSEFLQESSDRDDFLPNDTYVNQVTKLGPGGGASVFASADCDPGDKLLGGGGRAANNTEDDTTASLPFLGAQGWDYEIQDNGGDDQVEAFALCADFPPEH